MLVANDAAGERALASPQARGTCPGCDAEVIAKCGEIVIWHWSHRASERENCDPWWEESEWHRQWKAVFPKECVEVVIGPHRADVKVGDRVIEFQHSSISAEDVREREAFYGNMMWVFDVQEAYEAERLDLRRRADAQDRYRTFRWYRPWAVIAFCRKPVFLDLGDHLLEVKRFYFDERPAGWGYLHSVEDWIRSIVKPGPPMQGLCRVCGSASWLRDDIGPVHLCCGKLPPGSTSCRRCERADLILGVG